MAPLGPRNFIFMFTLPPLVSPPNFVNELIPLAVSLGIPITSFLFAVRYGAYR